MKATVKGGCTSAAARRAAPSVKHSARRVGSQPRSALSNASASCLSSSNRAILKISSNIKKGRTGRNALTALPKWRQKDGRIIYPPPCEIDHISRFDDIFRAEKPHLRHRRIFLPLFYHISFAFSRGTGLPLTGERATTHAPPPHLFSAFHASPHRLSRIPSPPFTPAPPLPFAALHACPSASSRRLSHLPFSTIYPTICIDFYFLSIPD